LLFVIEANFISYLKDYIIIFLNIFLGKNMNCRIVKPKNISRGLLITFEGGEGVGKSTQQYFLFKRLQNIGIKVMITHEPGSTIFGMKVRELLLKMREGLFVPWAELMLYLADRAQHVSEVIAPALACGEIVLCDRFIDSSEVYQGVGLGLNYTQVRYMNKLICAGIWPDITILFDLEPEQGLRRVIKRQKILGVSLDRLETLGLNFQRILREGFLTQAAFNKERIKVIDAENGKEEVAKVVWAIVKPVLEDWLGYGI